MCPTSEKKRHEIKDNRIRALYGHSTEEKIAKEISRPPDILYHGTANRFLQSILEHGLVSMERQYVHLSCDRQTAVEVGKRRDDKPVILAVHAAAAWRDGVPFYHGNETIWLADRIPAQYIELMDDHSFTLQLQQESERS